MPLSLEQLRSIQASPAVDGHAPLGIARIKLTALAKEGKLDEEDGSKIENTASASTGGSLGPGAARVRIRTAESTLVRSGRSLVGRHISEPESTFASGLS